MTIFVKKVKRFKKYLKKYVRSFLNAHCRVGVKVFESSASVLHLLLFRLKKKLFFSKSTFKVKVEIENNREFLQQKIISKFY